MPTQHALRALDQGDLEAALSELERCPPDEDLATRIRVAERLESIASAALELGQLLVRLQLADAQSPAATFGVELRSRIREVLRDVKARAGSDLEVRKLAPPAPCTAPEAIEDFLARSVGPSEALLRAPFGAEHAFKLHLIERDLRGRDIWWRSYFFSVPHGRSPQRIVQWIRLLELCERAVRSRRIGTWLRAYLPAGLRSHARLWLRRVALLTASRRRPAQ